MFGRKRRLADIKQALNEAMPGLIEAVRIALAPERKPNLAEAGDFYSASLGAMSSFLAGAQDLALKGAASQLGQRGGRKTQAQRRAKQAAAARELHPAGCPLCRDPMARNLSVRIIEEHNQNHGNASAPASDQNGDIREPNGLWPGQAIGYNPPDGLR